MDARTEEEKDVLREIGNIGSGNAFTSLSMMLGQPLGMEVPDCRIVKRSEAGSMLKKPESLYAGISMTMAGTFECMLALLMNKEFTKLVIETLDEEDPEFDVTALNDMQKSALAEVGNIMGNSYINAIGALLDMYIDVSVPSVVIDTGDRVLDSFLDAHDVSSDKVLFVNSAFSSDDKRLESYMLLCPTDESLTALLAKLIG